MSTIHFARVSTAVDMETGARLLRCRMEEGASLSYEAGQYLIINSGVLNEEGKPLKRAYTIFGMNEARTEFSLLAERLPKGVVSTYLNEREVGDRLQFTGPWGKFKVLAHTDAQPRKALCLAFGTGINALLGLFADGLPAAESSLVWVRDAHLPFMSDACLRDYLPQTLQELVLEPFVAFAQEHAEALLQRWPDLASYDVYLAGEGAWVDGLSAHLEAQGHSAERIRKEVFYRLPIAGG